MRRSRSRSGFTLIELAIGLAIAGLITGMAVVSVNAITDASLRSSAVELTGAVKTTYDRAVMQRRTQRIAMDLDKGVWWIEYTEEPFALSAERATGERGEADSDPAEAEEEEFSPFDDDEDGKAEVRRVLEGHARSFTPDAELDAGKPRPLPSGVQFSRVWTGHQEEPFREGVAYLYFFKGGFTEAAIIELMDEGEDIITLEVQPLTGRVRSHHQRLEIPDIDEDDGRKEGDE